PLAACLGLARLRQSAPNREDLPMPWKRMIPLAIGLAFTLAAAARMSRAQSPRGQRGEGTRSDGAQGPRRERKTSGGLAVLLVNPTAVLLVKWKVVQKDLNLTESQVNRITAIDSEFDRRRKEFAQAMTKGGGRLNTEALMTMIASVRQENEQ